MVATASARSVAVSCWALTSASGTARPRPRTATERMITRLIYLLLFVSPQVLLYLYLRERLPDPTRPERARLLRTALAAVFTSFNLPWAFVVGRVLFGSVWGVGRIPYLGPWIAWQLLGWIFCSLLSVYIVGRTVWRTGGRLMQRPTDRPSAAPFDRRISRRRFLARATYAYAGAGAALSAYGIWSAYRLPQLTRRTLTFPDLPAGLEGLTLLHLSDLHAGIHLGADRMQEIVRQMNALAPELIVQTGDMIDISRAYIPAYVRAFRELHAPLGVVTVLGIDDPHNWTADDPQPEDVAAALAAAPSHAFQVLLAHRPGAWDTAAPRGIPLTLAGHIHGGQFYLPLIGWSPGSLITKYVMGHFQRGTSQLYVSRGIGVVGVPIRVFAPPEIELFELRRG